MYHVKTMNKISKIGLAELDDRFEISDTMEHEDAILVRSAKLHDYDFPAELQCIARAGAGVHNIPLDRAADALRAKFSRAKNTAQSRGAIRSQVVLELENKLAREIITGYGDVTVTADSENPTVCLVDFSFTVAHGLNQIWLSAHITV